MPGSALKVIGESAFTICSSLAILDISATPLEAIEKDALKGCTGLSAISLPDTVTEIGDGAFAACFALKELDLPDSLVSLGVDGFMGCKALWRISIPAKLDLTADGGPRFLGLPSLYSLTFDQGRESLEGSDYFEFRGMVGITIPAGVRRFSPGVFSAQDGASLHIWFEGDCPEITGDSPFPENADITIYYDPNTAGWEACVWKGQYEMIPEDPLE